MNETPRLLILAMSAVLLTASATSCRQPEDSDKTAEPSADSAGKTAMEKVTMRQEPMPAVKREPEGFREARINAEMLNSRFENEEPPYRYYACGYVVLMFPADPEKIQRNRERYVELKWSEEEFESQLENSRSLWARLDELPGVSTPEELMDLLFDWVQNRSPVDNETLWKSRFREAFQMFTDGELSGR